MRYSLDEKLEQYKQVWLTKEVWEKIDADKKLFNKEHKEEKKKISLAKITNNKLAENYF